jgi:hypothetical protein
MPASSPRHRVREVDHHDKAGENSLPHGRRWPRGGETTHQTSEEGFVSAFRGRSRRPVATDASHPLDGLLQDMRELRLTLAADLHAAAAAAEEDAADVASDIVEADREELARFRRVAETQLLRLQAVAVAEPDAPRWRRRVVVALPAVPLVGAMALSAAAVTGVMPLPGTHDTARPPAVKAAPASPVTSSFQQLERVVDSRQSSASDVIAAARVLHRQLAALIADSSNDPGQAAALAELLRAEQSLLMTAQPPGASIVLDATRRLARQLVDSVPKLPKPAPTSTRLPTPLPSATSKGSKPSSSASPKKSTAPKPASSPSASPSGSSSPDPGHIPAVP